MEFDGVVVEDTSDLHTKAWLQLADEEGKSRPLQFALKRAEGMKNEQVRTLCLLCGRIAALYRCCVPVKTCLVPRRQN